MKLQELIEQYIAHRKSLGELQGSNAVSLRAFGRIVGSDADANGVRLDQVEAFLKGTGPVTLNWHVKLSVLRPFYRYAISRGHAATAPLPTVVPKRPPAFVPYIFTHDDLRRLLRAIDTDPRQQTCLEPLTIRTILLLLYGAGLRIREATDLDCNHVDLAQSLLTVRQSKFGKTRLVPVGPDLAKVLGRYAERISAADPNAPFFTTRTGDRVKNDTLQHNFRILCGQAGVVRTDGARFQPRIHDLRHSFAVHRLTSWYRQGADAQKLLPQLSVYLGHVHIRATQVYLTMTADLLHEAGQRFGRYVEAEVPHA